MPRRRAQKPRGARPRRATPRASRRATWVVLALAAIVALSVLLRGLYFRELTEAPDFAHPLVDADFHDYWARGLAFGSWTPPPGKADPGISDSPYLRPPGYPHFLAAVYAALGPGYAGPRVIQFVLGVINVLLAFWFGWRVFGRIVGLLLAALMASYWVLIYFEGELHAPVLVVFFMFCLLLAARKWLQAASFPRALLAGALVGIMALLRPNALVFLPAIALWGWIVAKQQGQRGQLGRSLGGLLLGAAIVILPVTARNVAVSGDFVLISSNLGVNLRMGNNDAADGRCPGEVTGVGKFKTCYDYPALQETMEERLGREIDDAEFSAILGREALHWIWSHPLQALGLTLRKAALFWGPAEVSHNKVVQLERDASRTLRSIPGNFPAVLSLALLGAAALFYRRPRPRPGPEHRDDPAYAGMQRQLSWLLIALILAWFLSVLPFFAAARYRVPIVPLLMVFSAVALKAIGQAIVSRTWARAAVLLGCAVILYGLTSVNVTGYELDRSRWHYARGISYGAAQRWGPAVPEFTAALQLNPGYAQAHIDLAVALSELGRTTEALQHLSTALTLAPDNAHAHFNMGALLAGMGELDRSIHHLSETLRIDPDFPGAREALRRVQQAKARTGGEARPRGEGDAAP